MSEAQRNHTDYRFSDFQSQAEFTVWAGDFKSQYPNLDVEIIADEVLLVVDGRRLGIENLFRTIDHDPDQMVETTTLYFQRLFENSLLDRDLTFDLIRDNIMPRIQPDTIFQQLRQDFVCHIPFIQDCSIVYVIDQPHMTISITTEQMRNWGVTVEEIDQLARKNLVEYVPELEFYVTESQEGGRAVMVLEQDGFDSARLLLPDLHSKFCEVLGTDFIAGIPSRDIFVAFSRAPDGFVKRLIDRVQQDFERLPFPITQALFGVTQDGIYPYGTSPFEDAA